MKHGIIGLKVSKLYSVVEFILIYFINHTEGFLQSKKHVV